MKRKVARLRLSPNEEAQLIREEHERRRKLRIQQVREQERYIALQIRREVQRRREREIQNLAEELREDWQRQQREKLDTLQKLYEESLLLLGEGHRSAKENEPDWEAIAQKHEENHNRAAERYHNALKELKSQKQKEQEEQNRFIQARKKAIQVEKMRAAKVASLPPPPPNPIENIQPKKLPVVKRSDVDAFSVTRYHMPETAVDREMDTTQPSAQQLAVEEMKRLQGLGEEVQMERQEQLEKARLRGNHALKMEQLTQDRERFLVELEHMQQTDLLRRRQVVSQMPAQIFQPLYKRQEMREDWQRDMEFAFEDMYTGERRVKGDLVLQLVPEPLPDMSTDSQDQELDLTLEEVPSAVTPPDVTVGYQKGNSHDTGHLQEPAAQIQEEAPRPAGGAPRQALRKLLNRIRTQRDEWVSRGALDQPAEGQTTDHQDMTIDSGSLSSEERVRPTAADAQPPAPPQAPPHVWETTEESIVAGTLLHPDEQAKKIHMFEVERIRREEELEGQKQAQLALLQELEEQKTNLELLLQEAYQERQQLQAAVDHQNTAGGTVQEVPYHDQEANTVTPPPAVDLTTSEDKDGHSRRIREYQQRLLEQNRQHKQSVEQARRRLEDYQRALRDRYNRTTTAALAPPGTTNPIRLLALSTGVAIPPAVSIEVPSGSAIPLRPPVVLSTHSRTHTPMEIPTRDSAILAQPSRLPGPGLHTRASLSIAARAPSVQPEAHIDSSSNQQPLDRTSWLTDEFHDRVTAHLPEGLRPTMTTANPLPYGPPPALDTPVSARTDPVQVSGPARSEHLATPPEEATAKPGAFLPGSTQTGQLRREEMQRQELQETQRRVQGQREALLLQQREQEELQREQWRRQKEALDALISADTQFQQPDSREDHQATGLEDVNTDRLTLMAALLRAIDEANGHTPPSTEANQYQDGTVHHQPLTNDPVHQSDLSHWSAPRAHLHAPRAPKPPVARARVGVMEMMRMEQHELSAIQEVETPVNASLVAAPEESSRLPHPGGVVPQGQDPPADPDRGSSGSRVSSRGEPSAGIGTGSGTGAGTGSGRSSKLSWRERLRLESGASPEPDPGPALPEQLSQNSSDSGRGGLGSTGPSISSFKPRPELESGSLRPALRPSEPDCLSSTTISSGSYVTTEPDHSSTHTDMSLFFAGFGGEGPGREGSAQPDSSSSRHSSYQGVSPPASPTASESQLHNSSIQRIIDKYTRELNISLSTAGSPTAAVATRERSVLEDPSASPSQQPQPGEKQGTMEEQGATEGSSIWGAASHSHPLDTQLGVKSQAWDNTVDRIMARLSDHSSSLVHGQGQDSNLNQTIGPRSDLSSCAGTDKDGNGDLHLEIGHPSARSSSLGPDLEVDPTMSQTIGRFSDLTTSMDGVQGWDSTLRRVIGRLSAQSSSQGLSGGRDFYANQLIGQVGLEQSSLWLEDGQDESLMRPLVAEVDESAAQGSGSSGTEGSNHPDWGDQGGSVQASVPSGPEGAPDTQAEPSFPPGPEPLFQALQPSGSPQEEDRSGVDLSTYSFHPLQGEITHNETAEPSMIFQLPPVEGESSSHDGSNHFSPIMELNFSEVSEGPPGRDLDTYESMSDDSDRSPEHIRTEDLSHSQPVLQDSLCQLTTSQFNPQDSALVVSPTAEEVGLTSLSLSGLKLGEEEPAVDLPSERSDVDINPGPTPQKVPEIFECAVTESRCTGEAKGQLLSDTKVHPPVWERIMEVGEEKGILEESQLTLVSLTDTTLQDQELTSTEEEEEPCEEKEDLSNDEKELETTLLPEVDTSVKASDSHAVMMLEFEGPSGRLQEAHQQKRRAQLLQKSARRVEEIKAKRAEARDQSSSSTKTRTLSTSVPSTRVKGETKSLVGGDAKVKKTQPKPQPKPKPQPPLPVPEAKLKKVGEVRICTPEQRKLEVAEMHQRTERLYNRLEEVKQLKEVKSRQESYAMNREKAKEFHRKTLQKLRAKQSPL